MAATLHSYADDLALAAVQESNADRAQYVLELGRCIRTFAADIASRVESLEKGVEQLRQVLDRPKTMAERDEESLPAPWDEGFEPRSVECLRLVRGLVSVDVRHDVDSLVDTIIALERSYAVLYRDYSRQESKPDTWQTDIGTRAGCHCCGLGCHICERCQPFLPQQHKFKTLKNRLRDGEDV